MKLVPVSGDPVIVIAARDGQNQIKTGRIDWQGTRVLVVTDPAAPFIPGERVLLLSRVATRRMQATGVFAGTTGGGEQFNITSSWASVDNRNQPRFDVALNVELHPTGGKGTVSGVATDISEGGIGIMSESLPEGSEFEVLIRNGSFSAKLPVSLVRSQEAEHGYHLSLQFHELTSAQRAFLRGLLIGLVDAPAARSA